MSDVWRDAMLEAFRDTTMRMALFLPKLLAMLSFLLVGLVVGLMIKGLLSRLLRAIRLDLLCERWGLTAALSKAGAKRPVSQLVARLTFWIVFLLFAFTGVDALDLPATANLMTQILAFLPHVLAGALILLVGLLSANFFSEAALIAAVNAQIEEARLIANLVRWGVLLFASAMVLTQLGIAKEIVVAAFSIMFGGVVMALAIAVGLGGRNIARESLERRFRRRQEEEGTDEMSHL